MKQEISDIPTNFNKPTFLIDLKLKFRLNLIFELLESAGCLRQKNVEIFMKLLIGFFAFGEKNFLHRFLVPSYFVTVPLRR